MTLKACLTPMLGVGKGSFFSDVSLSPADILTIIRELAVSWPTDLIDSTSEGMIFSNVDLNWTGEQEC